MANNKDVGDIEASRNNTSEHEIDELVNTHIAVDTPTSSTISSTRTNSPPLMGIYARAAKRRVDSDSTVPVRVDGTDTQNQQTQHHYQNVRPISDESQDQSNNEKPLESRESFSAKRDYFEQRFKTPPPTYDAPPIRKPSTQKIITTITTTTTTAPVGSNVQDRTSSSSNESPSVDRVLEQAVELQKLSNMNSSKPESLPPLIIERTEEYQVFLNAVNHEIRRTPSISRTAIVTASKIGHATDLDEAQAHAQTEHLTDDHEAIQQLTRALQEHNVTTINEYKRLPSVTTPSTPSTLPSTLLVDKTNLPVMSNEFSVIDALLNNPLGSIDDRYNSLLSIRYNDIVNNLHNPEYLNTIKQSTTKTSKETKKKPKEKKSKETKSKKKPAKTTETVEQPAGTPRLETSQVQQVQTTESIVPSVAISSEQTPLIDPKEKKKQDKENKKQAKLKSKQKSKNDDYEVLDAIVGSPISLRLPDAYLSKYHVSAPLSQSFVSPPVSPSVPATTATKGKTDKGSSPDKSQTLSHLVKIVHELQLHNATALAASLNSTSPKTNTAIETKQPVIADKRTVPITHESVEQQPLLEQQKRPVIHHTQTEVRPQSEVIKPRIIYRYIDEHGRVLKISSTPPSQLREQPSQQQYTYRQVEPSYFHGRYIAVEDERRHPLPTYEQRAAWQGEPKLPTTVTREDFESRDKRVPHVSEQSVPSSRTNPVSVDPEYPPKSHPSHHRTYHYPNPQNVKLAWLPLSCQSEQPYGPNGTFGYDTDSTISERSATYRPYEYGPADSHYYQSNRPLHNDYYYSRPSGPSYYPSPPPVPYGGRGISPEYGGVPRNYIEVFRGGDFRETKPSEIYSLPLNEHIRTSPITPSSNRHSRYDQYQSERYSSTLNRNNTSSEHSNYYPQTLPSSRYQTNIPPTTVHTSSYYSHRSPYHHRTVQSSPNPDYPNFVRQSKSFDYRPLRTKLQREYRITPNLLVDEWEFPRTSDSIKYSTMTASNTNRSGVSSPDDVFTTNP
ncbi:unnamed protein product [Adineta ricciae]|uniref:Uncharacterized protein n=1 Tax=Adineta ricciae TaxID=249248 RepID=A0A815MTF3_ADIRI|nr:unnamed protein product [Adineta ricciae]